jgi:GntR family transcriptional repressor for pyruvate dehydrogenase complex
MLKPISKSRLSQVAVERIKAYIVEQNLQPGHQLPAERQLSEALEISRNSVREALRVLEMMGMIEVKPGSGIYVKDYSGNLSLSLNVRLPQNWETLQEHFDVRLLLEPRAAALAAERATPEVIADLQEQMDRFRECVAADDLTGIITADREFHRLIAQATRHKTLSILMDTITHYLNEGWRGTLPLPGRAKKTIAEHLQIFEAIRNRDPAAAKHAMQTHLANAIQDLETEHERGNSAASSPSNPRTDEIPRSRKT